MITAPKDTVSRLTHMMRAAQLGGVTCPFPLPHPLYPIDKYEDMGARYWRWPDANEFGNGLQKRGKEPRGRTR